jgi:hypothetical protein
VFKVAKERKLSDVDNFPDRVASDAPVCADNRDRPAARAGFPDYSLATIQTGDPAAEPSGGDLRRYIGAAHAL